MDLKLIQAFYRSLVFGVKIEDKRRKLNIHIERESTFVNIYIYKVDEYIYIKVAR